jgi:hypothetical protein
MQTYRLYLGVTPRSPCQIASIASTVAYTAGGIAVVVIASRTLRVPFGGFWLRVADLRSGQVALRALARRRHDDA